MTRTVRRIFNQFFETHFILLTSIRVSFRRTLIILRFGPSVRLMISLDIDKMRIRNTSIERGERMQHKDLSTNSVGCLVGRIAFPLSISILPHYGNRLVITITTVRIMPKLSKMNKRKSRHEWIFTKFLLAPGRSNVRGENMRVNRESASSR